MARQDSAKSSDFDSVQAEREDHNATGDQEMSDSAWDENIVNRRTRTGFTSLDHVDLVTVSKIRASVMKSPPNFLVGAYRCAIRVALQEADQGLAAGNDARLTRAWKLFLLNASPQTGPRRFGSEGEFEREVQSLCTREVRGAHCCFPSVRRSC